jgi:hypothetical protein
VTAPEAPESYPVMLVVCVLVAMAVLALAIGADPIWPLACIVPVVIFGKLANHRARTRARR